MYCSRDELQRGRLRRVSPDGAQREVAVQQLTARVSIARRRMLLHAGIENWHQSTDTQRVDFMVGVHGQSDHIRRAPGRDVHQGQFRSVFHALLVLVLMSMDLFRPSRTPLVSVQRSLDRVLLGSTHIAPISIAQDPHQTHAQLLQSIRYVFSLIPRFRWSHCLSRVRR